MSFPNVHARRSMLFAAVLPLALLAATFSAAPAQAATNSLSITPIEWNVVGLDSNNVTVGPNQYSVGARVCNITAVAVSNVSVVWAWSTAATYINIDGPLTKTIASLAANTCTKLWWTVDITRNSAAYDTKRGFAITASAFDVNPVSTPATREIYVEHLVSQNRNGTRSLTGPTNVVVGQTVTYVLNGFTATNGYEQLSAGPTLDGSIFDIQSVTANYNKPTGATNTLYYADACGWNPVTTSPTYRSCIGPVGFTGGKAGGDPISVTVVAKVVAAGTGYISGNIYDYSGSSYHYNSDLTLQVVTSTAPAPPVANDDSTSTYSGVPVLINVPGNDTDANGDIVLSSVSVTGAPTNGITSVNATTGAITYTPSGSFVGVDNFTYQVCDSQPVCDGALVTVTVTAPPSPPVAVDDSASTLSGVAVVIDVPDNDSDPDNDLDLTSVSIVSLPSNGIVSVNPVSGAVTYTSGPSFTGVVTFSYEICDSQPVCDTALVTVTVSAPPSPPVAGDDSVITSVDVPLEINVVVNDSDPDGDLDVSTVAEVTAPTNGTTSVDPSTGKITYSPDSGFVGTDTFEYEICDSQSPTPACDIALVTVTVSAVPVLPSPPVAGDDSDATQSGVLVSIDVPINDSDVDGDLDPTSVSISVDALNGTTSVDSVTGHVTYTPGPAFVGTDTFEYEICDSQSPAPACDTALVTIIVSAPPTPPATPVATDDSATTESGVPVVIDVPNNDTDADNDIDLTTVSVLFGPDNGVVSIDGTSGEVTYTPDLTFVGTDTFTYSICDSQPVCDTAVVTVTVTAPPAPPVAVGDSASTISGVGVLIDVPFNDTDPDGDLDPSSVTIWSGPSNGVTSIDPVTGEITYTPDLTFVGVDTFIYEICDSQPVCDTALVTVTVAAPPSPPVAGDDSAITSVDLSVEIAIVVNDSDPDDDLDVGTVVEVIAPSNGSTSVDPATGKITYTPDSGFVGTDTFEYEICDSQSPTPACDVALVTVTISAVPVPPSPPVAEDDSDSTQSGVPVSIDVLLNDSDVDGDLDPATVSVTIDPLNGTTSVDLLTGHVTYTPDSSFVGTDTFEYQICDSQPPTPQCDTALVTITITISAAPAPPAPPVAQNNAVSTKVGTPVLIDVLDNDSDPDGDIDPSSVRVLIAPTHGTAVVDPVTFEILYTPEAGFYGVDALSYEICDLQTPTPACSTAQVSIDLPQVLSLAFTGVDPVGPLRAAFTAILLGGLAMVFSARRRRTAER